MLIPLLLALAVQDPPVDHQALRGWIEAGEPVAGRLAALGPGSARQVERALGGAATLPADWEQVLLLEGAGRALARRLAHDGLPAGTTYGLLAARLAGRADAAVQALVGAAALVPARISGRPAAGETEVRRAVRAVLAFLTREDDFEDSPLLFDRVRAQLTEEDLRAVVAGLRGEQPVNRRQSIDLLEAAPFSLSRDLLLDLALDQQTHPQERGRLAEHLVLGGGRPVLEKFLPRLGPQTNEALFRRMLALWHPWALPEDAARLEALAESGPETGHHLALQLWARIETDPGRRMKIFGMILDEPVRFQAPALEALAAAGPDERIAERLLASLGNANRDLHGIALAMLPAFAGPERLLAEYTARLQATGNLRLRGRWALVLSMLTLPAARTAAAEWLVEEGAESPHEAQRVASALGAAPEVDPYLGRLFRLQDLPERLVFRLALARAASSQEARELLRRKVESESSIILAQAVEVLAAAGEPADTLLLWDLARDPEFDPTARAAAVRGLARRPEAEQGLIEMLQNPPEDYEVAEALVRGGVLYGSAELRARALRAAREGLQRGREEERLGLRRAAWKAQAAAPAAAEAESLGADLARLLAESEGEGDVPTDLRRMGADHPELNLCALALAHAAGGRVPAALREWDPGAVPLEPLLWVALLLSERLPELSVEWVRGALARPGLSGAEQVRALSIWVRAAGEFGPGARVEPLRLLLADPVDLREHRWELEIGLGAEVLRGWVMPRDQLANLLLIAEAEGPDNAAGLRRLEALLEGFADPELLRRASMLALAGDGAEELGLALARRAVDWVASAPAPRLQLARALEAFDLEAARQAYRELLRMPLAGQEHREAAAEALQRLGPEAEREAVDR